MEALKLEAKSREIKGKQVKTLRTKDLIPSVVYGHGVDAKDLTVDYRTFEKVLDKAGESSLVDLVVDGKEPVKVLIQEIQYDALTSRIIHADFRQVRMTEKLEAQIEFNFVGEAPAIKEMGAILVRNMDTISVRCLPQYLVPSISIDLSVLKKFGDMVKVKDIPTPEGMEFLAHPNDVIIVANEPISEAELKELEAKPVEDVTVVKSEAEEKKAAAAAAEGEAPAEKAEKKPEKKK